MLIFYSNNLFYTFLILKKLNNKIVNDKILILLIVKKLFKDVMFIKKNRKIFEFLVDKISLNFFFN